MTLGVWWEQTLCHMVESGKKTGGGELKCSFNQAKVLIPTKLKNPIRKTQKTQTLKKELEKKNPRETQETTYLTKRGLTEQCTTD